MPESVSQLQYSTSIVKTITVCSKNALIVFLCEYTRFLMLFCFTLGWMMDDMRFTSFSTVFVISGRWKVDNERLCAMELRLRLRRFRLERGSNSVR